MPSGLSSGNNRSKGWEDGSAENQRSDPRDPCKTLGGGGSLSNLPSYDFKLQLQVR